MEQIQFLEYKIKKRLNRHSSDRTLFNQKIHDQESGNTHIFELLSKNDSCLIARIGAYEMQIINASVKAKLFNTAHIDPELAHKFCNNAGFFPEEDELIKRYAELCISDASTIDQFTPLGFHLEDFYIRQYCNNPYLSELRSLEPYYFEHPWSEALKNKRVLVISPFSESIKKQYIRRTELFGNPDILPEFHLTAFKSFQTISNHTAGFNSWFDALQSMKESIQTIDFETAIIGCGAYSFPLGAFIKKLGKQCIIMGGSTQILFGIQGKRWDNMPEISKFYNDSWVRPMEKERPEGLNSIENGCYW